jgi:hypothetical protein
MKFLLLPMVAVLCCAVSCSSYRYSIVPDEKSLVLLTEQEHEDILRDFKHKGMPEQGSSIHSVEFRSRLRTTTFEQAIVFLNELARLSLYTPNFSKLLFYAVSGQEKTISCDIVNKEAVLRLHPDRIYHPELPPALQSMQNYRAILLGVAPDTLLGHDGDFFLLKRMSPETEVTNEYVVKGRLPEAVYESLFEHYPASGEIRLLRVLLRPDTSKDVLEISYDYSGEYEIPQSILLEIKRQSVRIRYTLKKFNPKISGDFETLFGQEPPAGFAVYVVDSES